MARTLPPDSPGKTYLSRLAPVIRPIYTLLESGVLEAYRFHDDKGAAAIDPWLFSHLVRWHLCRGLDELQRTGDVPFARILKSMSGIEVVFDGLTLKVLRPGDDDNNLPIAKSEQQRLFYTGNLFTSRDDEFFIIKNLVVLWDTDHAVREVTAALVCPRDNGSVLWSEPIPHPATQVPSAEPTPASDDLDIPFERADSEEEREEKEGEGDDA